MGTPYRSSARDARTVVTRSVGGLGWPFVVAGLGLVAMAYAMAAHRNDEVLLDCPQGEQEACVVTLATGATVRVREYSASQLVVGREGSREEGLISARFGAYVDVPVKTLEDAERFVAAFKAHQNTGAACEVHARVGETPLAAFPFAALGLGLIAFVGLCRGKYRFIRDDGRGVMRVERASGFVARSVVEVPLADVEEIVGHSLDPARAFARFTIVFRMRTGPDVVAFPTRLNARDAHAVAGAASALLTDGG